MEGPLRYKELKEKTRMSDAWLSRKLREPQNLGVIISREVKHYLEWGKFREALKHEKTYIAPNDRPRNR